MVETDHVSEIPTVDLSSFFTKGSDEDAKTRAKEVISQACSNYGFFQVVNHGVPLELLSQALELSKTFFEYPIEEKLKFSAEPGAPIPAGYNRDPVQSPEKKERVLVFYPPNSSFNIYPDNPPQFKEVLQDVFSHLSKASAIVENILNECLGLPPNFLSEFNNDRSWDFMVALNYIPATETDNLGLLEHEDGNVVTFIFQDEAGGLEVRKNGKWIPLFPKKDSLVVNVADIIQVLSNKKFKSATHRVVRPVGKGRRSYAFFRNLHGDKWVEPLPQFTEEIGEKPKYKGFMMKEYQAMRVRNKSHPPSNPEDMIRITHYEINN